MGENESKIVSIDALYNFYVHQINFDQHCKRASLFPSFANELVLWRVKFQMKVEPVNVILARSL